MTYYDTGLTVIGDDEYSLGRVVRVASTHGSLPVQLYVSGVLTLTERPQSGVATFVLNAARAADVFLFLAVDEADRNTDFFATAFPTAAANGNRIRVTVPATMGYDTGDRLTVKRSEEGGSTAGVDLYAGPLFPNGLGAIGWGLGEYGDSFGYDGTGRGWGYGYGYQYGFGCPVIVCLSEPLPPGVYAVSVTVTDTAGNVSAATAGTITLTTYPRPAADLAVTAYDPTTDSLTLTWTASPDI